MAALLGKDAKLYRLTTGTRATWGAANSYGINVGAAPGSLNEIVNVRDLSLNLTTDKADVTTRGNNGWKAMEPTLKDGTITFQMVYDTSDADFEALQAAFLLNTVVALAALSGSSATAGTQGLWADFKVSNFSKSENLAEAQLFDVELSPAYSSVAPEWVKVS